MIKPFVIMFSGQGAQYFLMGKELYIKQPIFKKWMDIQDNIIANLMGASIIERLYDKNNKISNDFNFLRHSHPAIFMVQYALYQVLLELGVEPFALIGSSLGEYTNAAAAGVLTLEDALEIVVKQAEVIEELCKDDEGGMMTILHTPNIYKDNPQIFNNTELAGINYSSHFVISGKRQALIKIGNFLKQKEISFHSLPVPYGFHSSLVDKAGIIFKEYLKRKQFNFPKYTFLSCMTGGELKQFSIDYFWQIVRKPMLFPQVIKNLEKMQSYIYLDLSPSSTLANFLKYNLESISESKYFTFMSSFGSDLKRLHQFAAFFSAQGQVHSIKKEKKNMKVFMFPGQGSQRKGMGEVLFEEFSQFAENANDILGYSIKKLCLEDPNNQLSQTQFTQPAIYVVNALSYLKKIETEEKPAFVLGHSVAEFNALFASGVIDFESGLKLVKKRGELMAEAKGGGMAAVMGLPAEKIQMILEQNQFSNLFIANYNSSYQLVISGLKDAIEKAEPAFLNEGATHYRILNVSGAFHTPFMEEAQKKFSSYLKKFKFKKISIPIISNVTARPYKQEEIKENIISQITTPVRWMESIQYLLAKNPNIDDFYEVSGVSISVVKALAMRINHEAGPLDLSTEEIEKEDSTKKNLMLEEVDIVKSKNEKKGGNLKIFPETLGSKKFKENYHLKYPYIAGGMYKGIASEDMVIKMGKAGMMSFFGTGGLGLDTIETAIQNIQGALNNGQAYGMNIVSNPLDHEYEEKIINLFLEYNIPVIEAAAFLTITPALVKYRAQGLKKMANGQVTIRNKILAKVSRPEVAEQFLSPAPERILKKLLEDEKINQEQLDILKSIPIADDLIVEADSGGHTDQRMPYSLMPSMIRLRDDLVNKYKYQFTIHVGAAGGIGTPEAAAAAFILGADFIVTGSVNQCTVEAGTSNIVKDLLQQIDVQDTDYAPAGDMFELGARVQVLKRGVFFPARANKLHDLYRQYNSLEEIDEKTKKQMQEKYFKKSFEEIYQDVKLFYPQSEIDKAEKNPKYKMALIFRWYFGYSTRLALNGDETDKVNYQIPCGPALGAFNRWVKGTEWEDWRNRHVDEIGERLVQETADLLNKRFQSLSRQTETFN